jgi:hypothetical protein
MTPDFIRLPWAEDVVLPVESVRIPDSDFLLYPMELCF